MLRLTSLLLAHQATQITTGSSLFAINAAGLALVSIQRLFVTDSIEPTPTIMLQAVFAAIESTRHILEMACSQGSVAICFVCHAQSVIQAHLANNSDQSHNAVDAIGAAMATMNSIQVNLYTSVAILSSLQSHMPIAIVNSSVCQAIHFLLDSLQKMSYVTFAIESVATQILGTYSSDVVPIPVFIAMLEFRIYRPIMYSNDIAFIQGVLDADTTSAPCKSNKCPIP